MGFNTLHCACKGGASVDVVSKLIEVGGQGLVMDKTTISGKTTYWAMLHVL